MQNLQVINLIIRLNLLGYIFMLAYSEKATPICRITDTTKIQQEKMKDVLLLLQQLVQKEEVTVRLILDCLYDIGSVNLIDKNFHTQPLNRFMKAIATMTKPIFRIFAVRWFKKNCPQLIAEWLYQQVTMISQ
jgi:hypothetical protein